MRTTLTVDDAVLAELKRRAQREGVPLKEIVNRALARGLAAMASNGGDDDFETPTFSMGRARAVDLDKALALAAALEDEEAVRKLALRK